MQSSDRTGWFPDGGLRGTIDHNPRLFPVSLDKNGVPVVVGQSIRGFNVDSQWPTASVVLELKLVAAWLKINLSYGIKKKS